MIALQTKAHTLAESIILPVWRKMVKILLDDDIEQEISKILLSNNTTHRKITDLSADIEENEQNKLQNWEFTVQVDKSTDISDKTQLILTCIHLTNGNQVINQLFCCEEMPLTKRGQEIFDILFVCLEKWNWNMGHHQW